MNYVLTKYQKQELGHSLAQASYDPRAFVYEESHGTDTADLVSLTNRETSDTFRILRTASGRYAVAQSIPGSQRETRQGSLSWENVLTILRGWANEVKRESEAVDPWGEAEEMANDDSYFTLDELPRVDKAIDDSLNELKQKAIEHGVAQKRIETELKEMAEVLKKSARNSTKKEWISLFRGLIVGKLVDWGMQTTVAHHILHTLLTSAHEITQLAQHATHFLPG